METKLKLEYIQALFNPDIDYRIVLETGDCPQYQVLEALVKAGMITKITTLEYKIPASEV